MRLIRPCKEYKNQFLRFYHDLLDNDPENAEFYSGAIRSYSRYIQSLIDEEAGKFLKPEHVPCSHRWFINDLGEIVGVIRIRHNIDTPILKNVCGHIGYDVAPSYRRQGFGTLMLEHALQIANERNIQSALISADEDNIASRKVIEANGGKLDKVIYSHEFQSYVARYWVPTHTNEQCSI
ncbi:GNAT family N-acetyltransferase [Vibrio sp. SCSIO 43136]|uniref:GNAT family N-acetyltransferase n=1 Tax=Vibrio sp. SCSIO 43136 TaxID=2819101 RepID=UPI002075D709|nr:GNAT family N-acetyltransferase [Vibrio sp. SCSIO 43136]USD68206.1 GNAT family N-acetyltransferase [Vibrio sp. SCSIO 43136]